ncbi:MAG: hypothetical protein QQN41_10925, partial [Nitrosopumilus sp.]
WWADSSSPECDETNLVKKIPKNTSKILSFIQHPPTIPPYDEGLAAAFVTLVAVCDAASTLCMFPALNTIKIAKINKMLITIHKKILLSIYFLPPFAL